MDFKEKAKEIISKRIKAGGTLVSDAEYNYRLNVCKTLDSGNKCPFFGEVKVAGITFDEGCKICGCPAETKFRMASIDNPVLRALFLATGHSVDIGCPHPEGDMWDNHRNM